VCSLSLCLLNVLSRYTNKLLTKERLAPIGAEESLPQTTLYPTEKLALDACAKSACSGGGGDENENDGSGERKECETRQVEAERVSRDNSMWTFQCVDASGEIEEGNSELNGFDTRTGMPTWGKDGETKTNTKTLHGIGIRPSASMEHPIQLRNSPLTNVNEEKKKVSIFTRGQ